MYLGTQKETQSGALFDPQTTAWTTVVRTVLKSGLLLARLTDSKWRAKSLERPLTASRTVPWTLTESTLVKLLELA